MREIDSIQQDILTLLEVNYGVPKSEGKFIKLLTDGYVSSLQIIDLVLLLEDEFGVSIGSENMTVSNFDTVDGISRMVVLLLNRN